MGESVYKGYRISRIKQLILGESRCRWECRLKFTGTSHRRNSWSRYPDSGWQSFGLSDQNCRLII